MTLTPEALNEVVAWRVKTQNLGGWIDGAPTAEQVEDFRVNAPSATLEFAYAAAPMSAQPTRGQLAALWVAHGGVFFGPSVETGSMPKSKLLSFLQSLAATAPTSKQAAPDCARCSGSGEDPEGYFDQSRGPDGDTHDGPCRVCGGSGAAPGGEAPSPATGAAPDAGDMQGRECNNVACGWVGLVEDAVHPKHDSTTLLCPQCHETTEATMCDQSTNKSQKGGK